ncbi:MAG: DUF1800 domain-containing protein [Candidatus Binatia bacterium]
MKRSLFRLKWSCLVLSSLLALLIAASARQVNAQPSLPDIVRFLRQATFGPTPDLIRHVREIGFEAFLDEQFDENITPRSDYPLFDREGREMDLMPFNRDNATCPSPSICLTDNYTLYPLQVHFFNNALYREDQVRQRIAWALSQILVTSGAEAQLFRAGRMRHYQQLLYENALGKYRDILYKVTLSPAMGRYLDMVDNRCQTPTPPDPNICRNGLAVKPNENYAREILQLFSIGVYMLNPDGTLQADENGDPIFSYDQDTIEEFSRVFTGWTFAPQLAPGIVNYRDPMRVFLQAGFEARHDKGPKTLLNGFELPGGQSAEEELNAAIDNIISHPNTAPFISKILIQNLVTSNPSPAYVERVSTVFSANVDSPTQLFEVVKAILLDEEARGDFRDPATEPVYGKLSEPVLFVTSLLRAFNATSDGVLAGSPRGGVRSFVGEMDQAPFLSPTVFNFFQYADTEVPGYEGVSGPEFGIQSSVTAIRRANFVNTIVFSGIPPLTVDRPVGTSIDLSRWEALAADPDRLIGRLNQLLLHRSMSQEMRDIITAAVSDPDTDPLTRAQTAIYLIVTSSQYQVQR